MDATCGFNCGRYFHSQPSPMGPVGVLQLFVYLISEVFSRSGFIFQIP
jgi:hypothetical protein